MLEKIKELLYNCLNWSTENKQCRLRYERNHLFVNLKDLPFNCKGKGNLSLCPWYKNENFSDKKIKKMRQELRRKRP